MIKKTAEKAMCRICGEPATKKEDLGWFCDKHNKYDDMEFLLIAKHEKTDSPVNRTDNKGEDNNV